MATIKKLKQENEVFYPLTVAQAVIDPTTNHSVSTDIDAINQELATKRWIVSSEQTQTSSADGGTNVYTITMDNGELKYIQVKNGNKGDSGYTGAVGELEVYNDLDKSTAGSALDAYQGKVLNDSKVSFESISIPISKIGIEKGIWSSSDGEPQANSSFYRTPKLKLNADRISVSLNDGIVGVRILYWDAMGDFLGVSPVTTSIVNKPILNTYTFAFNFCIDKTDPRWADFTQLTLEDIANIRITGINLVDWIENNTVDSSVAVESVGVVQQSYFVNNDGRISTGEYKNAFDRTDRLKLNSNTIRLSLNGEPVVTKVFFWDENKEFLSNMFSLGGQVSAPNGACYFGMNFCVNNTDYPQFSDYDELTLEQIKKVRITGLEVVDFLENEIKSVANTYATSISTVALGLVQSSFYNSITGKVTRGGTYKGVLHRTEKNSILGGIPISVTLDGEFVTTRIFFWDKNDEFLSTSWTNKVVTAPSQACYFGINFCTDNTVGSISAYQQLTMDEIKQVIVSGPNLMEVVDNKLKTIGLSPAMYNLPIDLRKDGLKILDIGNSYTKDAQHYLSNIIQATGGDMTSYSLYRYHRPSGSFKSDVNCYNDSDTENYEVARVSGKTISGIEEGTFSGSDGSKFRQLISATKWDLIIIHQVSTYANDFSVWGGHTAGGYLKELIQILKTTNPQASLGFLLVHSYTSEYSRNTEGSSVERWKNIAESVKKLISNYGIDFIIPYGTAVQNLRESSLCDENEFSTDGLHMADGIGDYVSACCYYQSLFAPRFGSVVGNTYRNTSLDTTVPGVELINDANALLAQKAAMWATYNMFELTNPDDV